MLLTKFHAYKMGKGWTTTFLLTVTLGYKCGRKLGFMLIFTQEIHCPCKAD